MDALPLQHRGGFRHLKLLKIQIVKPDIHN